ncbi:hypothetical protein GCM10027036_24220 [Flavihumibacter cheonanensis]
MPRFSDLFLKATPELFLSEKISKSMGGGVIYNCYETRKLGFFNAKKLILLNYLLKKIKNKLSNT